MNSDTFDLRRAQGLGTKIMAVKKDEFRFASEAILIDRPSLETCNLILEAVQ